MGEIPLLKGKVRLRKEAAQIILNICPEITAWAKFYQLQKNLWVEG